MKGLLVVLITPQQGTIVIKSQGCEGWNTSRKYLNLLKARKYRWSVHKGYAKVWYNNIR